MNPISKLPKHWQAWYQAWDATVPESAEKRRLKGDLLGKPGNKKSYSAAFELYLFTAFTNLGLTVDFQPWINGVNPDFRIADWRGHDVYVEAGIVFNDPLETEVAYMSREMPIWQEFKHLTSEEFSVQMAHSSGNPGNVSPRSVRQEVQRWIEQLEVAEVNTLHGYEDALDQTFQFGSWNLHVSLLPKTPEDKVKLGLSAVNSAGFSGSWTDSPIERLRPKLAKKASQARETGTHCIVAIGERSGNPTTEDVQGVLFGASREYDIGFGTEVIEEHPYLEGLRIPSLGTDGLWSSNTRNEPIAVIVHRGDLRRSDFGELELWLNPNGSYFRIPFPLFALRVHSVLHQIWTKPASEM